MVVDMSGVGMAGGNFVSIIIYIDTCQVHTCQGSYVPMHT